MKPLPWSKRSQRLQLTRPVLSHWNTSTSPCWELHNNKKPTIIYLKIFHVALRLFKELWRRGHLRQNRRDGHGDTPGCKRLDLTITLSRLFVLPSLSNQDRDQEDKFRSGCRHDIIGPQQRARRLGHALTPPVADIAADYTRVQSEIL
ncbi:hypothetical protein JZ751_027341 [Albula glossodonta]|uniref:Uncharacterized protein n=1 Tax=Albula glossodonta TaxID=121402 RepID=A0A8T2NDF0_9TELE|nr:hypothetical protein JZ751_027341 [Albula glossodonta]